MEVHDGRFLTSLPLPAVLAGLTIYFLFLWGTFHALAPRAWRAVRGLVASMFRLLLRRETFKRWYVAREGMLANVRPYLPVIALVVTGGVIALLAGESFLDLADFVQGESTSLAAADRQVYEHARALRTPGTTRFLAFITDAGGPVGWCVIVFAAVVLCLVKNHPRWATYLALTTLGGGVINQQLKLFFLRQRPDLSRALKSAHGYSFPSGHAMGSIVVFGALTYLALRILRSSAKRSAALAGCVTLVTTVSGSRIYLGVHWITDIAAGLAAGAIWLLTMTVGYETYRRIRRLQSLRRTARISLEG